MLSTEGNTAGQPSDWDHPLGEDLPRFGPPTSRLWWYVAAGALLVPALFWGVVALYDCWFPPPALAVHIGAFAQPRNAALAWRSWYAADPSAARGAELWRAPTDGDDSPGPPRYLLVQPVPPGADNGRESSLTLGLTKLEELRGFDGVESLAGLADSGDGCFLCRRERRHLYAGPTQRWKLSLRQLAATRTMASLGAERVGRGTLFVQLQGKETRLVASSSSPDLGHPQDGLALSPFTACLPAVNDELAGAVLATPMSRDAEGKPETIFWTARLETRVGVFQTGLCTEETLLPRALAVADIPAESYPLLTTYHRAPPDQPFLLLMPNPETEAAAARLLSYRDDGQPRLQVVGDIGQKGIPAGGTAIGAVIDSFDRRLRRCGNRDLAVPARLRSSPSRPGKKSGPQYLVKDDAIGTRADTWSFHECPDPDSARYRVLRVGCEDDAAAQTYGEYARLTRDQKEHCRVSKGWRGCVVRELSEGCNVRVEAAPCLPCQAE